MNIKKLASMFGVETYEDENKQLHSDFENLARAHSVLQDANNLLAHDVISIENELQKIKADVEMYIEEEVEKRMLEVCNNPERHKAYQIGRMDAYKEMGIWNLEAKERGNCLVRLQDGDIVELIADDLVDVVPEGSERVLRSEVFDEIIIDDLEDIGA